MKKIAVFLIGITFFAFFALNANAEYLRVTDFNDPAVVKVSFDAKTWNYGASAFTILLGNDQFETTGYCVDLEQGIPSGPDLDVNLAQIQSQLWGLKAAWLFDEYNNQNQVALQLAIWEVIYADRFEIVDVQNNLSDYLLYLRSLPTSFSSQMAADLENAYDLTLHDSYQDLIVYNPTMNNPVPEPGTFVLFITGFVGLSGLLRKKIIKNGS